MDRGGSWLTTLYKITKKTIFGKKLNLLYMFQSKQNEYLL